MSVDSDRLRDLTLELVEVESPTGDTAEVARLYARRLEEIGLEVELLDERELVGPNWKIAYDGYLDFYHLPFLHRASFGTEISHRPIYNSWGPHQRVTSPDPALLDLHQPVMIDTAVRAGTDGYLSQTSILYGADGHAYSVSHQTVGVFA